VHNQGFKYKVGGSGDASGVSQTYPPAHWATVRDCHTDTGGRPWRLSTVLLFPLSRTLWNTGAIHARHTLRARGTSSPFA
jgi:hypothetical protein